MGCMKRMMIMGVAQVLLGCVVGLTPPPSVLHFRSIVTAHMEFCANGTLLALLGVLVPYMNLSPFWFFVLELMAYLGTFCNGGAFLISAISGDGTPLAPIVHEKHPFPNGLQGAYSEAVTSCLLVCVVMIIGCLLLAIIGLARYQPPKANAIKAAAKGKSKPA